MNLQDYIFKIPYKIIWYCLYLFNLNPRLIFYCTDPLDYEMFQDIRKHLPEEVTIIAKNIKTRNYLKEKGIEFERYPSFPKAVIMFRHAAFKFPVKKIKKIGFDHGLYQFKKWTSKRYYNQFDIYFVSSKRQVSLAKRRGITSTVAIGYPKLDKAFDGTFNDAYLKDLKLKLEMDPNKKTVIFSSTWNVDGLSALERWIDRVHTLTVKYNILLTVHTWTEKKFIERLKAIKGAIYIDHYDIIKYLLISDVFIGDYNSLIGEFCALDKPIITFTVPDSKRVILEVKEMISKISIKIDSFEEIYNAIEQSLALPYEKASARREANQIIFDKLDGKAGERAAKLICQYLSKL